MRVGTFGHPCRVKSFRKAVSAVMDDLEHSYSIIDNSHLINNNNLISKLELLQQLTHKIANSVSALWIVLSSRKSREGNVGSCYAWVVYSWFRIGSLLPSSSSRKS